MNHLIVYGLNYHGCPVAIRERFTIPESCLEHALGGLKRLPHIIEAVILSTCNRTEVYAITSDAAAGFKELESFFHSARQISDHQALQANFKLLRSDVTLHLMRVASGLDSMVLGEGQIMSQVKAAHQAALKAGTAGSVLDGLFKAALNCGKTVRSQTTLGKRAVSISSAAVELTKKLLGDLRDKNICVIGAGRMGQICIKLMLSDQNGCVVHVVNRSESKIKALLASNVRHLNRLKIVEDFAKRYETVSQCDAVIVAASANEFLLTKEGFQIQSPDQTGEYKSSPLQEHDDQHAVGAGIHTSPFEVTYNLGAPTHIIDMSVPRNVDPNVSEIDGINLHNFDDLAQIVKQNIAEREALTHDAEIIVFAALKEFERWQQNQSIAPVIAKLRGKVEGIRQSHLRRHPSSKRKGKYAIHQQLNQQLEKISRTIVNEILHKPTTRLKAAHDYQSLQKQTEALSSLFDLES